MVSIEDIQNIQRAKRDLDVVVSGMYNSLPKGFRLDIIVSTLYKFNNNNHDIKLHSISNDEIYGEGGKTRVILSEGYINDIEYLKEVFNKVHEKFYYLDGYEYVSDIIYLWEIYKYLGDKILSGLPTKKDFSIILKEYEDSIKDKTDNVRDYSREDVYKVYANTVVVSMYLILSIFIENIELSIDVPKGKVLENSKDFYGINKGTIPSLCGYIKIK